MTEQGVLVITTEVLSFFTLFFISQIYYFSGVEKTLVNFVIKPFSFFSLVYFKLIVIWCYYYNNEIPKR